MGTYHSGARSGAPSTTNRSRQSRRHIFWTIGAAVSAISLVAVGLVTAAQASPNVYALQASWVSTPASILRGGLLTAEWKWSVNDGAAAPGNLPLDNQIITLTATNSVFAKMPDACKVDGVMPESGLSADKKVLTCNLGTIKQGTAGVLQTPMMATGLSKTKMKVEAEFGGTATASTSEVEITVKNATDLLLNPNGGRLTQGTTTLVTPWNLSVLNGSEDLTSTTVSYDIDFVSSKPAPYPLTTANIQNLRCVPSDANPSYARQPVSGEGWTEENHANFVSSCTMEPVKLIAGGVRYRMTLTGIDASLNVVPIKDGTGAALPTDRKVIAAGQIVGQYPVANSTNKEYTITITASLIGTYTYSSGATSLEADTTNNTVIPTVTYPGTYNNYFNGEGGIWTGSSTVTQGGEMSITLGNWRWIERTTTATGSYLGLCQVLDWEYYEFAGFNDSLVNPTYNNRGNTFESLPGGVTEFYVGDISNLQTFTCGEGAPDPGISPLWKQASEIDNWSIVKAVRAQAPAGQVQKNLATLSVIVKVKDDAPIGKDVWEFASWRDFATSGGPTTWTVTSRDCTTTINKRFACAGNGQDVITVIAPATSVTKQADRATAIPGEPITYTMTYAAGGVANTTVNGMQLVDTLPPGMTYVPGSASPAPVVSNTGNQQVLTWTFNGLTTNTDYTQTYQAVTGQGLTAGATLTNTVRAKTQAETKWASATADVTSAAAGTTSIVKTADQTSIPYAGGAGQGSWTVTLKSVDPIAQAYTDVIDILPWAGDGRATTVNGSPVDGTTLGTGSSYSLTSVTPLDSQQVYYTIANPATLSDDPADPSNGTAPGSILGNTVSWSATKPANPTAIRVIGPPLNPGASQQFRVTVKMSGSQGGDVLVNRAQGRAGHTVLQLLTSSALPVAAGNAASLKKLVLDSEGSWQDANEVGSYPSFYVGDTITYQLEIQNTGQAALTNVRVTDPQVPSCEFTVASLPVGATESKPCTTTATTTMLGASGYVNVAKATATGGGGGTDPVIPDDPAGILVTPAPPGLDKKVSPAGTEQWQDTDLSVLSGDKVDFQVTVKAGAGGNENVQVNDLLPTGFGFVSAKPSTGTYSNTTGVWTIGNMTANQSATLVITATVTGTALNAATLKADGQQVPDKGTADEGDLYSRNTTTSDGADNVGVAVVSAPGLDKKVAAHVTSGTPDWKDTDIVVRPGDLVDYQITVTGGPAAVNNVVVRDKIPSGSTFQQAKASRGTYDQAAGTWTIPSLNAGETVTLTVTVRATASQLNLASMTADGVTVPDEGAVNPGDTYSRNTAPSDGADNVGYTVVPAPALDKTVALHPGGGPNAWQDADMTVYAGTVLDYRVQVKGGTDGNKNVIVTDVLPAGATLVNPATDVSTTVGTYDSNSGTWRVGDLAAGQVATLIMTVTANSTHLNAATLEADDLKVPDAGTVAGGDKYSRNTGFTDGADNVGATVIPAPGVDKKVSASATGPWQDSDLKVLKGSTVYYQVTVKAGANGNKNVKVTDALPTGATFVSATPSGNYDSGTGVWTVGDMAANATATLVLKVTVTGTHLNDAGLQSDGMTVPDAGKPLPGETYTRNTTPSDGGDTVGVTTVAAPALDKQVALHPGGGANEWQDTDMTVYAGTLLDYRVQVKGGTDGNTNVVVSDVLPAGATLTNPTSGVAASQGTYDAAEGKWTIGSLTAGQVVSLVLTVTATSTHLNASTLQSDGLTVPDAGTVAGTDKYSRNTGFTDGADNVGATVIPAPGVDKKVSTSDAGPWLDTDLTVLAGSTVFYQITVKAGADGNKSVKVTDALPVGAALITATPSDGSYAVNTGVWTVGDMTPGASATLVLKVTANGTHLNDAGLQSDGMTVPDAGTPAQGEKYSRNTTTSDGGDTVGVTTVPVPALDKKVAPAGTAQWQDTDLSVLAGDKVDFQITVVAGAGGNKAVQVADVLPSGLSYESAAPSQGSYDPDTGVWSIGDMTSSQSVTLVITATATGSALNKATLSANGLSIPDQGTVEPGDTYSRNTSPTDGADNVGVTVVSAPGLDKKVAAHVTSGTPDWKDTDIVVRPGDLVDYQITVTGGPAAATNVVVTDKIPSGATIQDAKPSMGTYDRSTGTWTIPSLDAGATVTLTVTVMAQSTQLNLASMTAGGVTIPDKGTVAPGDTYSRNTSTTDGADNVGFTVVDAPALDKKVAVHPGGDAHAWQDADVTVFAGTVLDYRVQVKGGKDGNTGVVVTDVLPAGATLTSPSTGVSASQGAYNAGSGVWTVGSLTPGQVATLTLTVTANSTHLNAATLESDGLPVPDAGTVAGTDTYSRNTGFTDGADNVGARVIPAPAVDKKVSLSANGPWQDTDLQVLRGNTVFYQVTVKAGADGNKSVKVTDALPTGATFVAATPSAGTYDKVLGVWTIGTMASNATATLVIEATATSDHLNDAGLESDGMTVPDAGAPAQGEKYSRNTTTSDGGDTVGVKTIPVPALDKKVSPADTSQWQDTDLPVLSGDQVDFQLTVQAGASGNKNVQLTDVLPSGLAFESATTATGTYDKTTGIWNVGDMTAGARATLVIRATVTESALNAATLRSDGQTVPDKGTVNPGDTYSRNTSPTDGADNVGVTIVSAPGLDKKVAAHVTSGTPDWKDTDLVVRPGDLVDYQISVTGGPAAVNNVVVTDKIPSGATIQRATPSTGSYSQATGVWTIPTLKAGETVTLTVTVVAQSSQLNAASMTAEGVTIPDAGPVDEGDTYSRNTSASDGADNVGFQVVAAPALDKKVALYPGGATNAWQDANMTVYAGTVLDYRVQVKGGADGNADVIVTDVLPAGATLTDPVSGVNASQGTYDPALGTWTVGDLAAGQVATLTLTVTATSTHLNASTLQSDGLPVPDAGPVAGGDTYSRNTGFTDGADNVGATVIPAPGVDKKVSLSPTGPWQDDDLQVLRGNTVYYQLTVKAGADGNRNVQVNDALPTGASFVAATPSVGTYNKDTGVWTIGTMASNATATLVLKVTATGTHLNDAGLESDGMTVPDAGPPAQGEKYSRNTTTSDGGDTVGVTTVPVPALDKRVSLHDKGAWQDADITVHPGDLLDYRIQVQAGAQGNKDVVVSDVLPAGATFSDAAASAGEYDSTTGKWTVGDLSAGQVATLTLVVEATGSHLNAVTMTSMGQDVPDQGTPASGEPYTRNTGFTDGADVVGATVIPAPGVDKKVALAGKTPGQDTDLTVLPGTPVDYILTVKAGAQGNKAVTVGDVLPQGAAYVTSSATLGSYNPTTGVWTLGDMAPNASAILTLTVNANRTSMNLATLTADGVDIPDAGTPAEGETCSRNTSPTDGCDQVGTQMKEQFDVAKTGSTSTMPLVAGSTITYKITGTNHSVDPIARSISDDLTHVFSMTDRDQVRASAATDGVGGTDVSAGLSWGGTDNAVLTWAGTLNNNQTVTITITVPMIASEKFNTGDADATLINTATAPDSNCIAPDPTDPACTWGPEFQELRIKKTVTDGNGNPLPTNLVEGEILKYTVTVTNTGQIDVLPGTITDDLQDVLDQATWVGNTTTTGNWKIDASQLVSGSGTVLTASGNLEVGKSITLTYQVKLTGDVQGTTTNKLVNVVSTTTPGSNCPVGSSDPDCSTVAPVSQLNIVKTTVNKHADGSAFTPGERVDYRITVTNTGDEDYTSAQITDHLSGVIDDATTMVTAPHQVSGPDNGEVTYTDADATFSWTGSLAANGGQAVIEYSVRVNAADELTDKAVLDNKVTSSTPGANCPEEGTLGSTCETHDPIAALVMAKSVSPTGPVEPGVQLTYKVTATNTGAADLTPAVVNDMMADVLDDASWVTGVATATIDAMPAGTVTAPTSAIPVLSWTGNLPHGKTVTITYQVRIADKYNPTATPAMTLVANNRIWSPNPGATCTEDAAPATPCATTTPVVGVRWSKVHDHAEPFEVQPGDEVTYTLAGFNNSATASATITATDDLADVLDDATLGTISAQFVDLRTGSAAPAPDATVSASHVLTWTGQIPGFSRLVITVPVTVTASGAGDIATGADQVLHNVLETSDGRCPDKDPCTPPDLSKAQIQVSKQVDKTTVAPGGVVHYTVRVENVGKVDLKDQLATDQLTDLLKDATYGGDVMLSDAQGGASTAPDYPKAAADGKTLEWRGNLPVSAFVEFTYSATVFASYDAAAHQGQDLIIDNTVTSAGPGSNCPDTSTLGPQCQTRTLVDGVAWTKTHNIDMSGWKTGQVLPAGTQVTYTITGLNNSSEAKAMAVSDDLAQVLDDATVVSGPIGTVGGKELGTVTWSPLVDTMFTWSGTVPAYATVTVTVVVQVSGVGDQGNHLLSNALDGCAPTDLTCRPTDIPTGALVLHKTSDTGGVPVFPGATIHYTLTAVNQTSVDISSTTVTDNLAGILDDGTVTPASLRASLTPGGSTEAGEAPTPSLVGDILSWTGAIASGEKLTLEFDLVTSRSATARPPGDRVLPNTVTADYPETNCLTGAAAASLDPLCSVEDTISGLVVNKSVSDAVAPSLVAPGSDVTYTLTILNDSPDGVALGPVTATDDLSDVLDDATYKAGSLREVTQYGAVDDSTVESGKVLTWTGTLPAGARAVLTYQVTVNDPVAGDFHLRNTVTVPGSNCDEKAGDPDCATDTPVGGLTTVKTSDVDRVAHPGDTVTYTITSTNNTGRDLSSVKVTDDLAQIFADAALVEGSVTSAYTGPEGQAPPARINGSTLEWTGAVKAGQAVVLSVKVTVKPQGTGTSYVLNNTAVAVPGDPEVPTNCAETSTDPRCSTHDPIVGLLVLKSVTVGGASADEATPALPGTVLTYHVRITNTGTDEYTEDDPASMVDDLSQVLRNATLIKDTVTAVVKDTAVARGTAEVDGTTLTWSGALGAGETVDISYQVTVAARSDMTDPEYTVFDNLVTVRDSNCPEGSDDPACNTHTDSDGFQITKTADADGSVVPGQVVTYTITGKNTGSQAGIRNLTDTLTDVLDDAEMVTAPQANVPDLTWDAASGTVMWEGRLESGASVTITYQVRVLDPTTAEQPPNGLLRNVVVSSSPGANCTDPATAGDECRTENKVAALTVVKSSDPQTGTSVNPGDTVTYKVTATNTGQVAFDLTSFTDTMSGVLDDAKLTAAPTIADGGGAVDYTDGDSAFTWSGGLQPGASVTVTYQVTVQRPGTAGDNVLYNVVTTTSPGSNCVKDGTQDPTDPRCFTNHKRTGLVVKKTSSASMDNPALRGQQVDYQVTLTNNGAVDLTGEQVVDDLSQVVDDATMLAAPVASSGSVAYNKGGASYTWSGDIPAGGTVTLTYSVQVNQTLGDGWLVNTVTTDPQWNCGPDSQDPDCQTKAPIAAVTVVKQSSAGETTTAGTTIRYTVTICNIGQVDYPGFPVRDDLSRVLDDATYTGQATSTSGQAPAFDGRVLTWNGDVKAGDTVALTYFVKVNNPLTGDGKLDNTVVTDRPGAQCAAGSNDPDCSTHSGVTLTALPFTGVELAVGIAALILVGAGLVVLFLGRRRRRAAVTTT